MSSTFILTHADTDGICAGAVALSKFPLADVFFTRPASLLADLKNMDADKIIIADIAMTKRDAPALLKEFRSKSGEIFYFDHHLIPRTVAKKQVQNSVKDYVHKIGFSSSELIYRYYINDLPRERVWLAIYGAIGDYSDETPFVRERIFNWDKRALEFEVSTISMGIKNEPFSQYDGKRKIVKILASGQNPSDISGLVRSASRAVTREFELYEIIKQKAKVAGKIGYVKDVPTFGFRGSSALFCATVKDTPIGISIHTRNSYLDITMRRRNQNLELNKLADITAESVGGTGGGHAAAAGAKIPLNSLNRFFERLNREMK